MIFKFEDYSAGDFFGNEDEVNYEIATNPNNPNRVAIAIARNDSLGKAGTGVFIKIIFRLVGDKGGFIQFNNQKLLRSSDGQDISLFVSWFGGTIDPR